MQAIILVGGLGTRLRSVLPDVPKPMAPIGDKPFLAHLLHYLKSQGMTSVILCVHYLGEKIKTYFQSHDAGLNIDYAEEDEPLGTGGAIVNALSLSMSEPVFVLNGDTLIKLDYHAMYQQHKKNAASMTMTLKAIDDCSRYGKVITQGGTVTAFREKGEAGPGLINAGVYLINPDLFSFFTLPKHFSFEKEFIFPYLARLNPQSFITQGYFIDIGIPEDYARAQNELPNLS